MIATAAIMAAWIVGGYLVGAIPFGWLIGKMRGVDIRQLGSKNIGATNCGRVCGWPCGVAAFLLDVLKGFVPVLAAVAWLPREIAFAEEEWRWLFTMLVAGSPILGHLLPVYLKFKGGKGVATSLGVVLALPMLRWVAVAAFVVWCLVVLATGYVSVASTVAALAFAGAYLWLVWARAGIEYLAVTVLVFHILGLVIIRHRANYLRLIKGTENGVLWRKKKEA
jgi:glycerol-3-phosphate acyltransferase PlsY